MNPSGPPPGINMAPILAALQQRQQGALGGGGTPMQQQQTSAAPTQSAPITPTASPSGMPSQVQQGNAPSPTNAALQAGQQAQGPPYDQQTRDLSKALVKKLLEAM